MLHVICIPLCPGYLRVRFGDSWRCSEEIVTNLIVIITVVVVVVILFIISSSSSSSIVVVVMMMMMMKVWAWVAENVIGKVTVLAVCPFLGSVILRSLTFCGFAFCWAGLLMNGAGFLMNGAGFHMNGVVFL